MTYNRRKFLKQGSMLASGFAFAGIACNSEPKTDTAESADSAKTDTLTTAAGGQHLKEFGIQLYTLRDDMPKDPKGVLKQVASFGYKQVEGYEGNKGLFWGMTNKDFKKYMDELGLTFVSSHCNTEKDFEKKAAQAGEIGMKYLISPYIGPQKTIDDYKKFADKFNSYGEICKKNGLRFAYHNHDYSFVPLEGQVPQDVLMQNTNADIVDYEIDVYWVVTAGADPVTWLQKYPNRFRLCHVKDRMKDAKPEEKEASVDVGTGSIDWKKVLRVAADNGMEYYIVEQERYDNSTPLKSAEAAAAYLKQLTI